MIFWVASLPEPDHVPDYSHAQQFAGCCRDRGVDPVGSDCVDHPVPAGSLTRVLFQWLPSWTALTTSSTAPITR